MNVEALSERLAGLVVAALEQPDSTSISVRFTNGAVLDIRTTEGDVAAVFTKPRARGSSSAAEPTQRQREYLEFIKKYMHRFGVAPAETDIQRHFLVTAPSVNHMVRTLEARGFIVRNRDWFGQTVPRSIRVVWEG
jgi:hypothetical protein